jgi:molybdenum cofactor cytidylyltransferase
MEAKNKGGEIGIILLAAGASLRLGHPKQLLPYKRKTLLRYSLEEALASGAQPLVVVLGANADNLQKEISGYPVHTVINEHWQEGMASSIRTGIKAITEINPVAEGAILIVCDQPFMTAGLLNTLMSTHQTTGKGIVACTYGNTFGPPAFFHQSFFPELLQLKGDVGARSIVQKNIDNVEAIPFPNGTFDIDTYKDYEFIKDAKP